MIIGVGTDMTDIRRIERLIDVFGQRFLNKCFCNAEIKRCNAHKTKEKQIAAFAKLFAAKEAVLKASGFGLRDGIRWHDIVIDKDSLGKPIVQLTGRTDSVIKEKIPDGFTVKIDISLSDEKLYALAFVVVSAYKYDA